MISVGIQEVFLHLKEMKTNNPHANVSQVQTHEQTQLSYVYNLYHNIKLKCFVLTF